MSLRQKITRLAALIADQAERDPSFAAALADLFGERRSDGVETPAPRQKRAPRRAAALFDPVAVAREGEAALRARLAPLDLEQLRAILADHAMDPTKKAMRWTKTPRVVEAIVALACERARKGDAFRAHEQRAPPAPSPPVA